MDGMSTEPPSLHFDRPTALLGIIGIVLSGA